MWLYVPLRIVSGIFLLSHLHPLTFQVSAHILEQANRSSYGTVYDEHNILLYNSCPPEICDCRVAGITARTPPPLTAVVGRPIAPEPDFGLCACKYLIIKRCHRSLT